MKICRSNLRQALCGMGFLVAMLGTVVALFTSSFDTFISVFRADGMLLPNGFIFALLCDAISSETMQFVLPIMAALPFTASYYDDLHSGFIKEYLPRTGYRNYITGKLIACYISGGLASVVGILCFGILSSIVFAPKILVTGTAILGTQEIRNLIQYCIPLFFSNAFWSLVGMTAAAITNSKHMAYAAPFILFYVLVILSERYFKRITFLNPKVWMGPNIGIQGAALLIVLTITVSIAFIFSAERGLRKI